MDGTINYLNFVVKVQTVILLVRVKHLEVGSVPLPKVMADVLEYTSNWKPTV